MSPYYDLLKSFFKKAPAELIALLFIMGMNLYFIYKIIPLLVGYKGPIDLDFLILLVQVIIFLVLLRLTLLALRRALAEDQKALDSMLSKERAELLSLLSRQETSSPPGADVGKPGE